MKNRKVQLASLTILVLAALIAGYIFVQRAQRLANPRPNIIFILTDDLDNPLMPYVENTNKLIGEQGATFTNYFVTSSACCPSRASTVRGQYPHNTGIFENSPGFEQFYRDGKDDNTLALWMKEAGYKNSYLGKYLNLYPAGVKRSYIPPGWTDWHVFMYGPSKDFYFSYSMSENGKVVEYQDKPEDYSTDVIKDQALAFIDKNAWWGNPFFLFIATYAPHSSSDPAPRHADLYTDLTYPQKPSFHEEDTSDKPFPIRDLRRTGGLFEEEEANDLFVRRVQSMQAVDEMVAAIVERLKENGQLDNTYIIFTSDNGFHMGEHNLPSGKMLVYEEDILVPLLVRGPGIPPGSTITQMTANIDIAPTVAEIAGAQPADYVDGRSFLHLFDSTSQTESWRKALLFETGYTDRDSRVIPYRGLRTETYKYVEYQSGDLEYYDLINDPYELDNIASTLSPETLETLHNWLEELKNCEMDSCRNAENTLPDISK